MSFGASPSMEFLGHRNVREYDSLGTQEARKGRPDRGGGFPVVFPFLGSWVPKSKRVGARALRLGPRHLSEDSFSSAVDHVVW